MTKYTVDIEKPKCSCTATQPVNCPKDSGLRFCGLEPSTEPSPLGKPANCHYGSHGYVRLWFHPLTPAGNSQAEPRLARGMCQRVPR